MSEAVKKFSKGGVTATLYLGDCRGIAPELAGVDAVISDPPYGMDWDTDTTNFRGGNRRPGDGRTDYGAIIGDNEPFNPKPWIDYPRCVLLGANHYAQRLPVGTTLVWIKKDQHLWGTFLSDAEVAWMKGGHGVYLFHKPFSPPVRAVDAQRFKNRTGIHPTQKPISLMSWCMDRAKVPAGATVLDPYMGSGTTGVACLRTGRNFIGIEKEEKYFEIASDRIEQEANQGQLFATMNAAACHP